METTESVLLTGPQLRRRWANMPNSTFYDRLQRGLIPPPEYPFGSSKPYWRREVIEAHERGVQREQAAQ